MVGQYLIDFFLPKRWDIFCSTELIFHTLFSLNYMYSIQYESMRFFEKILYFGMNVVVFICIAGILQVKGKLDTGKGAVFLVEKPTPGLWRLKCPSCTSESLVTSNGISLENIDFDYNFLVDVGINEKTKVISSSYPIKGIFHSRIHFLCRNWNVV